MENEQKQSGQKKLLIGVIAALLVIVGVTLYFTFSGSRENNELTAEKATLDASFKSLSDTLDVRSMEIEAMTSKNVKLDSAFTASQAMVEGQKKEIASMLSKVKMTKDQLASAKTMLIQYEASISDLQKKVVELTAENQQLLQQNQQLSTDLNSEKQTTAQLNEQNKGLSKTVEYGSLLQLAKVDVDGIKERQNGKEAVVKNAKAVKDFRITFETGDNKILKPGAVSFYVRIIDPKGVTITDAQKGSGSFTAAEGNTQMQYTKKADIDWNHTNKKVMVYYGATNPTAGIYKVEIYQSNYLIGKGEVKLN